jgi:hypothetical protein
VIGGFTFPFHSCNLAAINYKWQWHPKQPLKQMPRASCVCVLLSGRKVKEKKEGKKIKFARKENKKLGKSLACSSMSYHYPP